ncbi:Piwi-protein, putative [Giardia lamblia P15]|uniref:Piwi-protein, putative n=1 Tax=Giardia intestinalis (strain P15) TaxID=658858 RepID=E1EWF5_GIAIA|nr:Piwi-protein, putative [Giardia lamblia P15]
MTTNVVTSRINFYPYTVLPSAKPVYQYDLSIQILNQGYSLDNADSYRALEKFCEQQDKTLGNDPEHSLLYSLIIDFPSSDTHPISSFYSQIDLGSKPVTYIVEFLSTQKPKKRGGRIGGMRTNRVGPSTTSVQARVKITRVRQMDPMDLMSMKILLNILLKRTFESSLGMLNIRSGFYNLRDLSVHTIQIDGKGYDICWIPGFRLTTATLHGRLGLQILPETTRIRSKSMNEFLTERRGNIHPSALAAITVMTMHNGKIFRVHSIVQGQTIVSPLTEGNETDYFTYYSTKYKEKIDSAALSLLKHDNYCNSVMQRDKFILKLTPLKRTQNGKVVRPCNVPSSLCAIISDSEIAPYGVSKLSTNRAAVALSTMSPDALLEKATAFAMRLAENEELQSLLGDYGFGFTSSPLELDTFVCKPPKLMMDDTSRQLTIEDDNGGVFRNCLQSPGMSPIYYANNDQPAMGMPIWALMIPRNLGDDYVRRLKKELTEQVRSLAGTTASNIGDPALIAVNLSDQRHEMYKVEPYKDAFESLVNRLSGQNQSARRSELVAKIQLVVIVIPGPKQNSGGLYKDIKRFYTGMGVVTQCLLAPKPSRNGLEWYDQAMLKGICQQIYAKAGGAVWAPLLPSQNVYSKSTMLCGLDVSRPKKTAGRPIEVPMSTVGFISTYDGSFEYIYSQKKTLMPNRLNYGGELQQKALMRTFIENSCNVYLAFNNNILPDHIIIFRDGVSDGQISAILEAEIKSLYEYLCQIYRKANRSMCDLKVIVAQKTCAIRFSAIGGTVLRPGYYVLNHSPDNRQQGSEFLMASQAIVHGTTPKPIRYKIIFDSTEASVDDDSFNQLIELTNTMAYGYVNWPQAISLPHVLHMAHRLSKFCGEILGNGHDLLESRAIFSLQYRPFFI